MASSALGSLLLASLIGCGSAGTGEHAQSSPGTVAKQAANARATAQALATVRSAARATLAGSVTVEFRLDGSRALGSSPAPVLGSGEFDLPRGMGRETIDLGELAHQEPGTEHVVFLPSLAYLQPKSPTSRVLPPGKAWVSATLAGSDSVNTNFPSFALQAEAVNPGLLLSELAGGAIAAIPLGREQLSEVGREGSEAQYARAYEVTVDLARALSASAGPSSAVFGEAIRSQLAAGGSSDSRGGGSGRGGGGGGGGDGGQSAGSGLTSIAAWVDARGRVVQLQSSPPGAGVGTVTMSICCFGEAVHIAAPPPSQVVDIASLTPSGERENNGGGDSDGG